MKKKNIFDKNTPYENENYKLGFIYNEKENPKLFVPKGSGGIGWTLNFTNKWAYVILLIIGLSVIGILYFAVNAKD